MTLSQATRITGLDIVKGSSPGTSYHGYEAGYIVAVGGGLRTGDALKALVENNYRRVSKIVMEEQRYLCFECQRLKALEIDHVVPRARGRDDRRTNLVGLCTDCHRKKHTG